MRPISMMLVAGALIACGEKDTSTDDSAPAGVEVDADGDGSPAAVDCDDSDAAIYPGAQEVCDGLDNDCDGEVDVGASDSLTFYSDVDGDGYGDASAAVEACAASVGLVAEGGDCDDTRADIYPGAVEVCDGVDNGCDGLIDEGVGELVYRDSDGDGYGLDSDTLTACELPSGYSEVGGDCDDDSALASPGNTIEVCGDGLDNDCDGTFGSCGISGLVADTSVMELEIVAGDGYGQGGFEVANFGDSDGDGVDELLVAAPYSDAYAGTLWRISASGLSGEVEASDVYDTLYYARSNNQAGYPGYRVATGVDIDGDGVNDLAIGDPYASGQSSYGGAVHLINGSEDGRVAYDRDFQHRILGVASSGYFGAAMAFADDLNGDGSPDLVASERGYTDSAGDALGRVAVFTQFPGSTRYVNDADVLINGATVNAYSTFGEDLDVDDIDGDGLDDIAVASYGESVDSYSYAGAVFIFSGPASGNMSADERDAQLEGVDGDDYFGYRIALGDVDGDGYGDLFAGAPGRPGAGSTSGEAALFLGPFTGAIQYSDADATLLGASSSLYAAQAVDLPGDLDGDGDGDLVVNDLYLGGNDHGALHIVYWPAEGSVLMNRDATIQGTSSATLGSAFTGGDFDGDGTQDLLVGATGRYTDDTRGSAFLFLGGGY